MESSGGNFVRFDCRRASPDQNFREHEPGSGLDLMILLDDELWTNK